VIGNVSKGPTAVAAAAPVTTTVTTTVLRTINVVKSAAALPAVTVTTPAVTVPPVTFTSAAAVTPVCGGTTGPFQDGTYLISVDIQTGNYTCSDPVGGHKRGVTQRFS